MSVLIANVVVQMSRLTFPDMFRTWHIHKKGRPSPGTVSLVEKKTCLVILALSNLDKDSHHVQQLVNCDHLYKVRKFLIIDVSSIACYYQLN
jgi:hypothetical protein